jgi:hypothetical protein
VNAFVAAFPEFRATADIYAPGTASMAQVGTAVPGLLVPNTPNGPMHLAPEYLAGGRVEYLWIDAGTARLGIGCEVRPSIGGTYEVHGTADWELARVCLLSKLAGPFTG